MGEVHSTANDSEERAMKRTLIVSSLVAWLLTLPAVAGAVEFEPFASVESVCPDCNAVERDVITLTDDQTIEANVVAENVDFLVVERYGEVRAIPRNRISSTEWAGDQKPSGLREGDQIVLKNGGVLTGNITDESEKPGHFELKSAVGDTTFTVFKKQIDSLYRDGQIVNVTVPATDGDDGE